MTVWADYIFDAALAKIQEANALHLCTSEPTTYGQATTTGAVSIAHKTGPSITGPTNGTVNGRKVTVSAISDGVVDANGTATHFALVDTVNSRLLVTGPLSASKALLTGNPFTTNAFDLTQPDAV